MNGPKKEIPCFGEIVYVFDFSRFYGQRPAKHSETIMVVSFCAFTSQPCSGVFQKPSSGVFQKQGHVSPADPSDRHENHKLTNDRICFNYQLDAELALSNERCLAVRDYSLLTIRRTKTPQGELPKCHGVCVPQHPLFAFATDWSEAHTWSEISCEGQKPAPRQAHSAVIGADGRMWVYGGNAMGGDGPPGPDAFFKATMRCVAACHLMFSAAKT